MVRADGRPVNVAICDQESPGHFPSSEATAAASPYK